MKFITKMGKALTKLKGWLQNSLKIFLVRSLFVLSFVVAPALISRFFLHVALNSLITHL